MSTTETHFGKLKKVEAVPTVEEWCKKICNEKGVTELASYNDTWQEQLRDDDYNKYFFIEGEIWEAIEHIEESDGGDIDLMLPNPDGTITFVQQFYNGGTCLSECLEEGLKRLKESDENFIMA